MSRKAYIFVHGLSGWGSYDETYRRVIKAWLTGSEMPEAPEWHTQFCHGLKRQSE